MVEPEKSIPWKAVVDTLTDGLMLVAADASILFVNHAMERISGYKAEEILGKPCSVLRWNICRKAAGSEGKTCDLFRLESLPETRCVLTRKDGTRAAVLKKGEVLRCDGGEIACGVETITERVAAQSRDEGPERLQGMPEDHRSFHGIIGASPQMRNLYHITTRAAASDAPVLIYGESGTGKELVAGVIHRLGTKSSGPFIRVNCASLSETLLESELFGHVKGAYTGAHRNAKGRFEAAHKGDIFLDEIGDLPPPTQVRLLRVLQEKEIERVGDYNPIKIDVRVIAATHRDLRRMVEEGRFREDLFYRLNVIPIFIPPLRERTGDLPLLVDHFMGLIAAGAGKGPKGIAPEAISLLARHGWPGNVRELINALEYAFVVCSGDLITPAHLPESLSDRASGVPRYREPPSGRGEKELLVDALIKAGGKRKVAARILGVSRQTLWNRMKKHGIDAAELLGER